MSRNPDDDRTQPLAILTPADLAADQTCSEWMQYGKQLADKREQRERVKELA